ncbi:MAG: pyridoxal-phosphate dependent enzyme [Acidobacteria bacterium]|nr:pyridoxal-phosphate dependent enzyme [Acidobacteriota bacterium]
MTETGIFPLLPGPTPLTEAPRLTRRLGGPRILVKRDDLTGRGLGGNKVRKLEYLLGEALAEGATHVVTGGGAQSNHACLTAVTARMAGLEPVLVLSSPHEPGDEGNRKIESLLGVRVDWVREYAVEALERGIARAADRLRDAGARPCVIPMGGSNATGIRGYERAAAELAEQCRLRETFPDAVVTAVGTGGTLAGLVRGARRHLGGCCVVGIDVGAVPEGLGERCRSLIGDEGGPEPGDYEIDGRFRGRAYAAPTPEGVAAMRLFLETEGLLLDPVYTGKAAAGLVSLVGEGVFGPSDTVVFLHTGGAAGFFTGWEAAPAPVSD